LNIVLITWFLSVYLAV